MVTVEIIGGPSFQVKWDAAKMHNAQDALEDAFNSQPNPSTFTYTLQYYGSNLGYLVNMINETFDTFPSASNYQPYYFWEFLVNNVASNTGIDNHPINDGDKITFDFTRYIPAKHANTTMELKHKHKKGLL